MILINAKFTVKDEYVDTFLDRVADFTADTRAEEGNIFFNWYRSTEESNVFYLAEAFADDAAEAHVTSAHFKKAQQEIPPLLVSTPDVINTLIEGKTEWDKLGEFEVK
ncbi:putative quinol monooxygenase [Corynebacterium choanae]|uniref:Monooxygenase YcnE n=1 Tax=Corynebacterium choanae TaxID=1862358 RepID=A0A3G6J9F5_9CORY|nr:putative quinol monooxygenase [Corynebacterium choanae]AZA14539.1 Putative monooxygenase YcnE [Corynebacterium choanae]